MTDNHTRFPIPPGTPVATVTRWQQPTVHVLCPYCGAVHGHQVAFQSHRPQWRGPGCGLTRSATDRTAGYVFRIERTRH